MEDGRDVERPIGCYRSLVSLRGLLCVHCHLQQSSHEQSGIPFWYNILVICIHFHCHMIVFLFVCISLVINILCSLFWSATTLTSWHLIVTFCTLHVAQRLNFFENKPVDMKTVVLFGILNGVSIGFLNLSLGFNSIGFYQMTKLAIIPFTVLLETIFLMKQFR